MRIEDLPDNEDYRDEEYPDASGEPHDAGTDTCPNCGASMYGDAPRCPTCGDYVTPGSNPRRSWPWWFWVGLILSLVIAFGLAFS